MKILIFCIYFFNMDILLIIALICLEICMYIPKMYLEGRVSQNFDIGLSFCFVACRRWNFFLRHVACILLLEWSTTSQRLWVYRISVPYAQKDPGFLFEERRGQPREFWSLFSTIDGSTLPQDCVEEQLCS